MNDKRADENEIYCFSRLGVAGARGELARRLRELGPPENEEYLLTRPLGQARFLVVDLETTGMKPGRGRIIELGAVEVNGFSLGRELSSLVNPGVPLSPFISALTGIKENMVRRAPRLQELLPLLENMRQGRLLVAHNLNFDLAFLEEAYQKILAKKLDGPVLCTLKLARRVFPELPSHNLDAVSARLRIKPQPHGIKARHRALGDARIAAIALIKICVGLSRKGVHTTRELLALQKARRKKNETPLL